MTVHPLTSVEPSLSHLSVLPSLARPSPIAAQTKKENRIIQRPPLLQPSLTNDRPINQRIELLIDSHNRTTQRCLPFVETREALLPLLVKHAEPPYASISVHQQKMIRNSSTTTAIPVVRPSSTPMKPTSKLANKPTQKLQVIKS